MLDKFLTWSHENGSQISWFIIGFLSCATIDAVISQRPIAALVMGACAVINYITRPR